MSWNSLTGAWSTLSHINYKILNPYPHSGMPVRWQSQPFWQAWQRNATLMVLTKLAVLLATSLADWTKCLLATGLVVLEEARRQVLHSAEVCLATMVAAESTCHVRNNKKWNGIAKKLSCRLYADENALHVSCPHTSEHFEDKSQVFVPLTLL